MEVDPNNIVVQLCAAGMDAEGFDNDKAIELFNRAWEKASNDFEAFIAAHYLARHQDTPENTLKWNLEALNRALAIGGEEVAQHLPSLYLNAGKSYEDLGDLTKAEEHYRAAAQYAAALPQDGYVAMITRGITSGLERVSVAYSE